MLPTNLVPARKGGIDRAAIAAEVAKDRGNSLRASLTMAEWNAAFAPAPGRQTTAAAPSNLGVIVEDLLDLDQEVNLTPAGPEATTTTVVEEIPTHQTVPGEGSARRTVSEAARRALNDLMLHQETEPGAAQREDLQYMCVVCGRGRVRNPGHKCMDCMNRGI